MASFNIQLWYNINTMFDRCDPAKSAQNKGKHGLDFQEAQSLWADSNLLVSPAKKSGAELRLLNIGVIDGKHWTAITTMRGDLIRIISVRRSRKKEVEAYES